MKTIKLTAWNIEHLGRPLNDLNNRQNQERLKLISKQISWMNPDILCVCEAPADPRIIQQWLDSPAENGGLDGTYKVAMIDDTLKNLNESDRSALQTIGKLYETRGNQWIWFILKNSIYQDNFVRIQKPSIWQNFTGLKNWTVHYWGNFTAEQHRHFRHPQTVILNFDGYEIEVVGVHLKSKINRNRQFSDETRKQLTEEYVIEALKSRVKLATEAFDIRRYIDQRFEMEENPRIIICGDLNDGPGREFFERKYLFFDLLSNVQGDVFFASKFLNHSLFDYAENLRWTTQFNDRIERWALENYKGYKQSSSAVDNTRHQLIDHILFTQEFVNRNTKGPKVLSKSGYVEHVVHNRINSMNSRLRTSDHRPLSLSITLT